MELNLKFLYFGILFLVVQLIGTLIQNIIQNLNGICHMKVILLQQLRVVNLLNNGFKYLLNG
jgi:hypothetical protein